MPTQRLDWIDVAKGLCIALVVLGHTSEWYVRKFAPTDAGLWAYLWDGLRPLRMPLFFTISGMLAASKIDRPLHTLWDKTGGLYLLYCVWTAIYWLKLLVPAGRSGLPAPDLWQSFAIFALPSVLWYIWALPAYYLFAWTVQRLFGRRSIYALIPLFALALAAPWIEQHNANMLDSPLLTVHSGAVAANLLWFYIGLKGRDWLFALAAGTTTGRLLPALTLGIGALVASWYTTSAVLDLLMIPLVLWAAITALAWLRPGAWVARPFRAIGKDTLPVYVMHTFVLTGMSYLVAVLMPHAYFDETAITNVVLVPILISAAIIYGCILSARMLHRCRLGFLVTPVRSPFSPPSPPRVPVTPADGGTER